MESSAQWSARQRNDMYTIECEVRTATGEAVIKTVSCRTQRELELTIKLIRNCGHKLLGYKRTFEGGN